MLLVALFGPDARAEPDAPEGLGEVDATRRFCAVGPEQALVAARRLQGEALVADSEVLPNPSLWASHGRVFGDVTEAETVVGLGVPLGVGGRRFVLQDAAAAQRAQLQLAAASSRIEAAIAFRRAYVTASMDAARMVIERRHQRRYRQLLAKLRGLQAGGERSAYDAMRLETEAELHLASMELSASRLAASRAWLAAMVGAPVALSEDVDALARFDGRSSERNAKVASLEAQAEVRSIEARAARRRWVPDVTLFAGYRALDDGDATGHGFSVQLSVPLTFFDHGQGEARRAEAGRALAEAQAEQAARDARASVMAAAAQQQVLTESAGRVDRALVDARAVRQSAERLYLAGEGPLLAVLEAFGRLRALGRMRVDVAAAMADARLDTMQAAGRFGERRLDAACGVSR